MLFRLQAVSQDCRPGEHFRCEHITERLLEIRVALKIAGPMTICALTKEADACRVL